MKKFFAILMAALMAVSMFAACGSSAGNDDVQTEGGVLKIGMTGPLTGGAAEYGLAVEAGIEIAVEEINAAAEANGGLKLAFKSEDDEADGEKAVSGYNVLKDWGLQVFIGTVTSGACNAVAPEAVADEIFLLTPSASATEVAMAGASTFQMCFTDPNQGASAAEVIEVNWSEAVIGVIYDSSDDYSSGLYQGFMKKANEMGLDVVVETSFTKDTKSDLSTQVTQCKDAGATLMFLPIYYSEASQILTYANKIGYAPVFFGCDGMDGILGVEGFDVALAEGLSLMTPFDANATDEATVSFVTKFKAKMNGLVPNQFAADGYDCIYAIYNACVEMGINGETPVDEACALVCEWFNTTEGFDGLTGKGMTWDAEGMISKIPAAVVVENGIYVPMG